MLERAEKVEELRLFSHFFHDYRKKAEKLRAIFEGNTSILKKLYLLQSEIDRFDYDGSIFRFILDQDVQFMSEYLEWLEDTDRRFTSRDLNLSSVWKSENYQNIINQALEFYTEKAELKSLMHFRLRSFFEHVSKDPMSKERAFQYLSQIIVEDAGNRELMVDIFKIIAEHLPEERVNHMRSFLSHNASFDDFKYLPLEPSGGSWSGSAVPYFERRIQALEEILSLFSRPGLLKSPSHYIQHKLHVQAQISAHQDRIEQERKRDFIGW